MLELKDFTFTPKLAAQPILEAISFRAQVGESISLTGASGSGKSTLLQALAGFMPDLIKGEIKGELELDGQPIHKLKAEERLHLIGYISSEPRYQLSGICSTVREEVAWSLGNLGVNPSLMSTRTEDILQTFDLQDLAQRHPQSLSSGQQQRLILASVLIWDPTILLLDEPAAFLDTKGRQTLLDYITKSSSPRRLIIWASSSLEEATYFPRWLQLDKGRLISDGPPCLLPHSGSLKAPWTRVLQGLNLEERQPLSNWPLTEVGSIDFLRQNGLASAFKPTSSSSDPAQNQEEPPIEPPVEPPTTADNFTLSWRNVSFSYDGQLPTLREINLTLQAPDCVAFWGANGAGKTTLAQMGNGLLRPQQGAVLINGQDTSPIPPWQLASQVGFVFHNAREQVFASNVWTETAFGPQNLGLAPQEVERRCQEALELTHLLNLKELHPYELSNAQLRRLSWASVLAMPIRAVIMDEPNAALDEESWQIFTNILSYLRQQRKALVVLITHNIDLISQYCQKIVYLERGRLLDYASPEDILRRHQDWPRPSVEKFAQALQIDGCPINIEQLRAKIDLQDKR